MDLRNYKAAALAGVEAVNVKDSRWDWHLSGLGKKGISIRWSYLDYIGQKADFEITYEEAGEEKWLSGDMGNDYIDDSPVVTIGDARWDDAKTIEEALRVMIRQIAMIAHSRY